MPKHSGPLGDLEAMAHEGLNAQAGDYTFALVDDGRMVEGTKATAQTFTIPLNATVAFDLGATIDIYQGGAGQITVAAAGGVTLRAAVGAKTAAQYAVAKLRKLASDEWVLSGNTAA